MTNSGSASDPANIDPKNSITLAASAAVPLMAGFVGVSGLSVAFGELMGLGTLRVTTEVTTSITAVAKNNRP